MNGTAFKRLRRFAPLLAIVAASSLLGGCLGDEVVIAIIQDEPTLWVCTCACDEAGVAQVTYPTICAYQNDLPSLCVDACGACSLLQVTSAKPLACPEPPPPGGGETVAGGVLNASEMRLSSNQSVTTLTYLGLPTTLYVDGDVKLTGGCEGGTCPISFNSIRLTSADFSVREQDSSTTVVTDVVLLNNGLIDVNQVDGFFTIPSGQISLLGSGAVNGVSQPFVFSPSQDVSGFYVPSTGSFGLSAHFFSGNILDLQLDLEGAAYSRPPVADARCAPEVTAEPARQTAIVALDGSGSTDLDNDLTEIAWFEGATYLGSGSMLNVRLGVGSHILTAVAIDATNKWSFADTTVTVLPG